MKKLMITAGHSLKQADGIIGNLTLSKMMEEWGNKI